MTASFHPSASIASSEDGLRPLKISELAEKFGISLRTLRFYEEKGLLKPGRKDGWARLYRQDDIARLDFILICRAVGLSIDETRHLVEAKDALPEDLFQRKTMEAVQERINAIRLELETRLEQQRVAQEWLRRLQPLD